MKKYYLKIVYIMVVILLAAPQVASASWWNPFSWSIFNKTDNKNQILEKKIQELENKIINNTVTVTPTPKEISTTTTVVNHPVEKKKVKKDEPSVDNSLFIQAQIKAQVEAQLKEKAEQAALVEKQKAEEQRIIDAITEENRLAKEKIANLAAKQAAEKIAIEEALLEAKQTQLNNINQKIVELNVKYSEDMKKCSTAGGTTAGVSECKNLMTNRYIDDYNVLMAEFQRIKYSN